MLSNVKTMVATPKGKMMIGAGILVVVVLIALLKKKKSNKNQEAEEEPKTDTRLQAEIQQRVLLSQQVETLQSQVQYCLQQIKLLSSTPRPVPYVEASQSSSSGLMFTEKRGQSQPQQQVQRNIPQDSPFSNLGGSMSAMSLDFGPNGGIHLGK